MLKRTLIVLLLSGLAAGCSAGGTSSFNAGAGGRADSAPVSQPGANEVLPKGYTPGEGTSGSTAGPHEGERASTPPGTSRGGIPPVGGAIVDPTGAVTKTPPPEGMR